MFMVRVTYPSMDEETRIVDMTTRPVEQTFQEVLDGSQILDIQDVVRRVPISEHVLDYVLRLVRATRPDTDEAVDVVRDHVTWGAGPRASQFLVLGSKARALLHGRLYVSTEDVKTVALPVLRHRIITNYGAQAEGWTTDRIILELLERIPAPESETLRGEHVDVLGS
jgi:MoxR-like ATPase